jgi:hypothetical protein
MTASQCFAVGSMTINAARASIIEEWDGASWHAVNQALDGWLTSVSCPSAAMCMATGKILLTGGPLSQAIADVRTGSSWEQTAVPEPSAATPTYETGPPGFGLAAVSCLSASDCWAVGSAPSASAMGQRVLVEHWSDG